MKKKQRMLFLHQIDKSSAHGTLNGHIALTYRCNLNCVHCYCKGAEDRNRELKTEQWQRILDILQQESCLALSFTGGDPLARDDFLQIYSYAKAKGFLITLFTNGLGFTDQLIEHLIKSPPLGIEITLNGITKDTYESITHVKGSFSKAMRTIKILAEKRLPLILKANCLQQNKHEVGKIKAFSEELLGKCPDYKFHFKYDQMIYPRLDLNKAPTDFRLSFKELLEVRRQDPDIWKEYQSNRTKRLPRLTRKRTFLYNCNFWTKNFFIDPYGRLQPCMFSDKFSSDLKTTSFREGFYNIFPQLLKEKFKTNSKCKDCRLRSICYYCPARAYLETGDQEAPVAYFCQLAEATYRDMKQKR
ncbi:radical SAM protein [Candidatus Omnitrophota bacterium]